MSVSADEEEKTEPKEDFPLMGAMGLHLASSVEGVQLMVFESGLKVQGVWVIVG